MLSPFFSLLWFRCLSPFFSLLSFLRTGVLSHHDLLVPLGSGFGFRCLSPFFSLLWFRCLSPFFSLLLSSGKGFCSIMICWLLLVPAGSGACLPFFSRLSFLRKGVLFHHDLLVPSGSGWGSGACLPYSLFFGSGACLPSFLFFLSSGQGFCSIMICWLLLVRVGFRCLSPFFSLLWCRCLSPFFSRLSFLRTGFLFHHDLLAPPGSGRFRCLSPFFSRLSFLRKEVLFHYDLLVPLGPGWGSGACLLLSSFFPQEEVLFHHDLLVPLGSRWGSGACLPFSLFFDSGACLPSSLIFLSSGKGLGVLFHHDLLVLPGSGWGSGWGSGACLPSFLFFPQDRDSVPS